MKSIVLTCLLVLLGRLAVAQTSPLNGPTTSTDAQRAAISTERSRLEADFLTEDAACYKRFAVNSCLSKVTTRRREALGDLRRQEILLNDKERRIKGEEQIRKTEEKSSPEIQQQAAARRAEAADEYQERLKREKDKQQDRTTLQSNEKSTRDANAEKLLDHQKKFQARTEKQTAAADESKKFNRRQKEALERQAQHDADQLKRVKPAAKPLPLPE